jgi:hypothetical protein
VADVSTAALELSWMKVIEVWWSFFWRTSLYGSIAGLVLGAAARAIAEAAGHLDMALIAGKIAGYIVGAGFSIVAMRQTLRKHLGTLLAG